MIIHQIGPQFISHNVEQKLESAKKSSLAAKSAGEPNYRISWPASVGTDANTGSTAWTLEGFKDVEIVSGSGNNLTIDNVVTYDEAQSGGIAVIANLSGIAQENVKVVLENLVVNYKDSLIIGTDGFVHFPNAPIINSNPEDYQIRLTHLDGKALPTQVTRSAVRGGDYANIFEVDFLQIANEQDITFTILDYQNLTIQSGVTVELLNAADDSVLDTQVSDANGEIIFDNVAGQGEYKTRTSMNGYYTKTVGIFVTPLVDTIDEMTENYNTTTIPLQYYTNGDLITGEQANKYRLLATDTELIHLRSNIYLANVGNRQFLMDEINYMDDQLGFTGATTFYLISFGNPTQDQIDNYNQYGALPYGNNIIGTDAEPVGTDTDPIERPNGIFPNYSFNASTFKLGATKADVHHEDAQKKGFEQIAAGTIIPQTCLDSAFPSELSMYDIPNMRMKLKNASNHFKELFNGKPAEYNFKTFDLNSQ